MFFLNNTKNFTKYYCNDIIYMFYSLKLYLRHKRAKDTILIIIVKGI